MLTMKVNRYIPYISGIASLIVCLLVLGSPSPAMAQTSGPQFGSPWSSTEADTTTSMAWGDFDNDGDLDLLVGNGMFIGEVHNRLYCNEAGVLTSCWESAESEFTLSVAWGDMDGDGDLDLAVGNGEISLLGGLNIGIANRIYRNDGFSSDGEPILNVVWSSTETDSSVGVAWGDYDNDGDLDLAVANGSRTFTDNNIGQPNRIYRNNSTPDSDTPSFTLAWTSPTNEVSIGIEWVDVDSDGDLDLAIANDGANQIYCNDNEALTLCWQSNEQDTSLSMSWGDYDNDGDPDLAVGNGNTFGGRSNRLYRNDEGVLTTSAVWNSDEADATLSVEWGDADGDGDLDLAVGNGNIDSNQPNRIYCNHGGVLDSTACWTSSEADITTRVAWGDVDNDGALDLAVGNISFPIGQPNRLYPNISALITEQVIWSTSQPDLVRSVAWGDMDGDGDLDLAVGSLDDMGGRSRILRNTNGSLENVAAWVSDEIDDTRIMAWGDMDDDGDLDLAVGNSQDDPNRLYRNDGIDSDNNPIFTLVWSFASDNETRSLAWGDFDGDGDLDLAAGNGFLDQFGSPLGQQNRLYCNRGMTAEGLPHFEEAWSSDEVDATRSVAWGDVDGDGDLDLAVANSSQPSRVYINKGMTSECIPTFEADWSSNETGDSFSVAWGDVEGDGDLDLAIGNTTQFNRLYCNENGELSRSDCWSSNDTARTRSITWGDIDGDGDLDLAAGNQEGPNHIYLNNNGELTPDPVWMSDDGDFTWSLALGDLDRDGDLDMAVGSEDGPLVGIYRNMRRNSVLTENTPPFVTVTRPGETAEAPFYSSPRIIRATEAVPIRYTLFSADNNQVARIFPEYSPNGGGEWFTATQGAGGDALHGLSASAWPTGTVHTFSWDAAADLIKSDNVVFRIRAQPHYTHSPILWPAVGAQSSPFRIEAPWFIKVVDETQSPVTNAEVYANGVHQGMTDRAGLLNPDGLAGTQSALVALTQREQQSTARLVHDNWAYRTYLTSLEWDENGNVHPYMPTDQGEQRLIVHREQPLILFNLVVSIEWDATITYTDQISNAIHAASDYLFDLTDGQMAFGHVAIYDRAQHWENADLQISARNTVRPHAYVGGIISNVASQVIRIGRKWNGTSGNEGDWNLPTGFRTITHEFGHYGLHLYDEYFGYFEDDNGNLTEKFESSCIGPENREAANDAINASAMDYQYTSSELSDRGLPGQLWSPRCEETAQWQLSRRDTQGVGESAWESLIRYYGDPGGRWHLLRPTDRGRILPGPIDLPSSLPDWPQVEIANTGASGLPYTLTVVGPNGPFIGASVTLDKTSERRLIEQGSTLFDGQIEILGAETGDIIRASSIEHGLAGNLTVSSSTDLTLALTPIGVTGSRDIDGPSNTPYIRVVPESVPNGSTEVSLSISLRNFAPPATPDERPTVLVSEPGSNTLQTPMVSFSDTTGQYNGEISLAPTKQGTQNIQVIGRVAENVVFLQSSYRLQRVDNRLDQTIFSNDGNISLFLNPDSLPGEESYFVVMTQETVPGPLPMGLSLVGDPYEITASGAILALDKQAVLSLQYDSALFEQSIPEDLGIYWWNAPELSWVSIPATVDEERNEMVASIDRLGVYALLAPIQTGMRPDAAHIRVGSGTLTSGESITIPIELLSTPNTGIGGATIGVHYDSDLLSVANCLVDPGNIFNIGMCSEISANEGEANIIRFSVVSTTAISQPLTLAEITLQPTGALPGSSLVDLTQVAVVTTNGESVEVDVEPGEIVVEGGILGDVNCDNDVDNVDALSVLQFEVGLRSPVHSCAVLSDSSLFIPQCDVSGDNDCNLVDAILIMQCHVGISNRFCP